MKKLLKMLAKKKEVTRRKTLVVKNRKMDSQLMNQQILSMKRFGQPLIVGWK